MKVKLYPTLIDSYKMFLTTDFISFNEMIDRINRVPRDVPPIAKRGTLLNTLIDELISGVLLPVSRSVQPDGSTMDVYQKEIDGLRFEYPKHIVDTLAKHVKGAQIQVFSRADLSTSRGEVELYGYADYVLGDAAIDLKCKDHYKGPAYQHSFQHKCYLYTLKKSGFNLVRAEYLITDLVDVYTEQYHWSEKMLEDLIEEVTGFLEFVDKHRDVITDKRVLGV